MYMGKYQKHVCGIKPFTQQFFLSSFLFKQNERLLMWQKLILKFHLKKSTPQPLGYNSKNILSEESVVCFQSLLLTFFSKNFASSISTILVNFFYFFTFTCNKEKYNDISIYRIISAVFALRLFQIGCLRTASSYINIQLILLPV